MPNQPPLNPDALEAAERWMQEKSATFGLHWKNAKPIIEAYLAVAQPEVNSVESIPATIQIISWEKEPEHECWKLSPDETFVGLIVKSGRSWSPAEKYTLRIERPAVNDA